MQSLVKSKKIFFLGKVKHLILKFIWKYKGTRIVEMNFITNEVKGLILTDFKTYYEDTEVKTVTTKYWHQGRQIDQ